MCVYEKRVERRGEERKKQWLVFIGLFLRLTAECSGNGDCRWCDFPPPSQFQNVCLKIF
jgi:hypothetical protein